MVNTNISNCHVRALVADDGLEAVQKAAVLKPDLILLDIGLPGLNDIEVASRITSTVAGRENTICIWEQRPRRNAEL